MAVMVLKDAISIAATKQGNLPADFHRRAWICPSYRKGGDSNFAIAASGLVIITHYFTEYFFFLM